MPQFCRHPRDGEHLPIRHVSPAVRSVVDSILALPRLASCVILVTLVLAGCSRTVPYESSKRREHPDKLLQRIARLPMVESVQHWPVPAEMTDHEKIEGLAITTAHYRIFTTLEDPLILRQAPFFLESAFESYSKVLGQTINPKKKLQVYFWQTRQQWEQFTRYWAGRQAPLYMKIKAGAYYLRGACVTYHIRRDANFAVLAHEGWHQFSHQLFKYRLPSWLDEGLATNFETYTWEKGKITFDPRINGSRLLALKKALLSDTLMPLSTLLVLDPGRVIGHNSPDPADTESHPQVAAFYGQVYALVRFMREYNYGQHLADFQKMLNDARLGKWPLDDQTKMQAQSERFMRSRHWNDLVGPMIFQRYIGPTAEEFEQAYQAFVQKTIARVRFKKKP